MGKSKFEHSIFDPLNATKRYKQFARGLLIPGEDDRTIHYKKRQRIRTQFVEMSWSKVLVFAVLNAIAISATRIVWFSTFGKPDIFSENRHLEERYQRSYLSDSMDSKDRAAALRKKIQEAKRDSEQLRTSGTYPRGKPSTSSIE